jgi:hypothetical protein
MAVVAASNLLQRRSPTAAHATVKHALETNGARQALAKEGDACGGRASSGEKRASLRLGFLFLLLSDSCRRKVLSKLLVECVVLRRMRHGVSIKLTVCAAAYKEARPLAGTVAGIAAKYTGQTSSELHGDLTCGSGSW